MSDLTDIVGDDLEPAELERLARVHELLLRAGPPPELPPSAARSPEPPTARVIPFPRRYRFTSVAVAAVAALALFVVGYVVGNDPGKTPVETVTMAGADNASGELDVFEKDAAGNWPMELRVRGLAPGSYELWLTRGGELAEPCGVFAVATSETTVPLNAPYLLKDYDGWVVVEAGAEEPVLTT